MSHYTAIKTKFRNFTLLKKCLNKLEYSYTEHKNTIEIHTISATETLSSSLYKKNYSNFISFRLKNLNYDLVSDFQSWTKKDALTQYIKKLELNYSYSETISQALELGFTRSQKILNKNQNNKFVFQRCVEITV